MCPMPEREPLFLSEQHPLSGRHVVLEDDGQTIWLYLTAHDSIKPVTDVWVYNRSNSDNPNRRDFDKASPPVAGQAVCMDSGCMEAPHTHRWSLVWSSDGEAAAVLVDAIPVAFVRSQEKPGFSRQVKRDCAFGRAWSECEYLRTFTGR